MLCFYVAYLLAHQRNELHRALLRKLSTAELRAALRARGLLWHQRHQPLRVATNSKELGLKFLDLQTLAVDLQATLEKLKNEPKLILSPEFDAFPNSPKLRELTRKVQSESAEFQTLLQPDTETEALWPQLHSGAH